MNIKGIIRDFQSGEPLLYSNCYDSLSTTGVSANSAGMFYLRISRGQKVVLKISHVGYFTKTLAFIPQKDTILTIELISKATKIKEVIVNDFISIQEQDVLGKTTVPIHTIQSLPSFVGIPDLMKAISFIPGVSTGKEGYSNIYVRGGDRGQNLILLDGIKLYNTNHVGGFLSLLNTDILNYVEVYKGGFPARFGGRASSVIDIYSKDGNKNSLSGKFIIGLLNSGLALEGPINKKLSFYFSGRSSYYDLFTISSRKTYKNTGEGEFYGYTFFDINSKITWQPNDNHKLFLSVFTGHDFRKYVQSNKLTAQKYEENDKLNLHSTGISLQHKFRLSTNVYLVNIAAYSNYNNNLEYSFQDVSYGYNTKVSNTSHSEIKEYSLKSKLDFYQSNIYTMRAGIESSLYQFTPGIQTNVYTNTNAGISNDTTIGFTNTLRSVEASVYHENEVAINKALKINIGLRGTAYFCNDTSFFRLEPRISLRYLLTSNFSFKSNFTIMNQYNHVLVNNVQGFEREIWFSATKDIPPQIAKQFSAGFFYGNESRSLDLSLEGYYKKMENLTAYRSPVFRENNLDNISNIVAKNGIGESYGVEILIKKAYKRFNVNLNYSLSWNNRKFEVLNNGNWYPFFYDRRHDISLVTLFNINNVYSIGSNFIFTSGAPITLPDGFSKPDDLVFKYYIYDGINNKRLPPYHRLDLILTRKTITKRENVSRWSLNIFNVYARQNPVYIYYDSNTGKAKQKSLFSIVPTINYSYEF